MCLHLLVQLLNFTASVNALRVLTSADRDSAQELPGMRTLVAVIENEKLTAWMMRLLQASTQAQNARKYTEIFALNNDSAKGY